ncbi:segregation/condensation protein A [Caldisericum exile]|uniref:Segregation and condensation protein A n=1 Tax=Caldisericum exile (strain DSM 21853 / NBRC 104410 / AZM16c01) TaxID=511051 RepID=A0A7U6JFU3_CALEA|nr:segregation/condensation protein A [Caldisericum exile]BAL80615.1 segregation and condensation protein A [Caldisericum exile AZM16c01]
MSLEEIVGEAKRSKNYLLSISILELIDNELQGSYDFELSEKILLLATLLELKSELLLYLLGLKEQRKKTLQEENIDDIIDVLEKSVEKTVIKRAFVEKVSANEIPVSRLEKIVKEVLQREKYYENKTIPVQQVSVAEIIEQLKKKLTQFVEIDFKKLIEECNSKIEVIATFLAVLILAKNKFLRILQEDHFSPIILRLNEEGRVSLRN